LEWIEAAHWDNMSYQEFREMPGEYQSKIVAAMRSKRQAEAVKAWAERPKPRKGGK